MHIYNRIELSIKQVSIYKIKLYDWRFDDVRLVILFETMKLHVKQISHTKKNF